MFQILDTLVSEDVLEEYFCCDLAVCKGICCVEGDEGAPVEDDEIGELAALVPAVWDDLSPRAQAVIERQGATCPDRDGDPVTSIVEGEDCVFTCYADDGICRCALEKAFREGRTGFYKPISCHLYPVRVVQYGSFQAVNYHRWNVCRSAVILGKKEKIRAYQFLKEPLIRKFGEEWYRLLCLAANEWNHGSPRR
jgi:hypothetical protein